MRMHRWVWSVSPESYAMPFANTLAMTRCAWMALASQHGSMSRSARCGSLRRLPTPHRTSDLEFGRSSSR